MCEKTERRPEGTGIMGALTDQCNQQKAVISGIDRAAFEQERQAQRLQVVFNRLNYHAPTEQQIPKYTALRDAAKAFATVIVRNCPAYSSDSEQALDMVEKTLMIANKAIALE